MFHLHKYAKELRERGVECKVVLDRDYIGEFPSKDIRGFFRTRKKFERLISTFKPDAVVIDRMSQFGFEAIKSGIPLFVISRGHYWMQNEWNLKTVYKNWLKGKLVQMRFKVDDQVFQNATAILVHCDYLVGVIKEHYPKQNVHVFPEGLDSSNWYQTKTMKLKHPCVGLVQRASWWGKNREMLILKKILGKMPEVNFYWAGGGDVQDRILPELEGFKNFHWLGSLQYPDKVRDFLSEIDIYLFPTRMDTTPLSLREAELMKNPVVATNVGGISEAIIDGVTGFLVEAGNHEQYIEKLKLLLDDKELRKQMGEAGRKFVEEKFNQDASVKDFLGAIRLYVKDKREE